MYIWIMVYGLWIRSQENKNMQTRNSFIESYYILTVVNNFTAQQSFKSDNFLTFKQITLSSSFTSTGILK